MTLIVLPNKDRTHACFGHKKLRKLKKTLRNAAGQPGSGTSDAMQNTTLWFIEFWFIKQERRKQQSDRTCKLERGLPVT